MQRQSGILLHPTSLPGKYGIGTLGRAAHQFVDFLHAGGQTLWQVLPICPTGHGNSPYQGICAFAGNPMLIDLDFLVQEGDLSFEEIGYVPDFPLHQVDFDTVVPWKTEVLMRAASNFFHHPDGRMAEFEHFCAEQAEWLEDYALFAALRTAYDNKSWKDWDPALICREPHAMHMASEQFAGPVLGYKYMQFQFYRQWFTLKNYANSKGVSLIGDIPIFVAYDSSDVWASPHLFHLDDEGRPTCVAGVPPDYFSEDGQLWGNPLYRWDVMQQDGYAWWVKRISSSITLYDMIRVDHFRGFEAFWEIPGYSDTAKIGSWVPGPAWHFFQTMVDNFGHLPFIAEDLGIITPEVENLRDQFNLPGMKVLQFAFDGNADNAYLPYNHVKHAVVYTGTHDNDTTQGWWDQASEKERNAVRSYIQKEPDSICWEFIHIAMASICDWSIIHFQDLLSLGTEHRMNIPGTVMGNWLFRASPDMFHPDTARTLGELSQKYGRI